MFRDVPECSGLFHVPGFIDAQLVTGSFLDGNFQVNVTWFFAFFSAGVLN